MQGQNYTEARVRWNKQFSKLETKLKFISSFLNNSGMKRLNPGSAIDQIITWCLTYML